MIERHGEVREGFLAKTGFTHVYHVDDTSTGLDLASEVLYRFDAEWLRETVDTIIYVTSTGDRIAPGNGHLLHARLGLSANTLIFDLNDACTGFLRSLILANSLLRSKSSKNILLVLSDTYSKLYPESNLKVSPLFSDAASAFVISGEKLNIPGAEMAPRNWELLGTTVLSEGSNADDLTIKDTSGTYPMGMLEMNGGGVFNFVVKHLKKAVSTLLSEVQLDQEHIDSWYIHQGSRAVVESVSKSLGLDADKQFVSAEYGNVVGSAIPFQIMDDAKDDASKPSNLMMLAFGVGLTFVAMTIKQK